MRFVDLDLTEASSSGATFIGCAFLNVKFNVSVRDAPGASVTSAQAVETARGLGLIVDES